MFRGPKFAVPVGDRRHPKTAVVQFWTRQARFAPNWSASANSHENYDGFGKVGFGRCVRLVATDGTKGPPASQRSDLGLGF